MEQDVLIEKRVLWVQGWPESDSFCFVPFRSFLFRRVWNTDKKNNAIETERKGTEMNRNESEI